MSLLNSYIIIDTHLQKLFVTLDGKRPNSWKLCSMDDMCTRCQQHDNFFVPRFEYSDRQQIIDINIALWMELVLHPGRPIPQLASSVQRKVFKLYRKNPSTHSRIFLNQPTNNMCMKYNTHRFMYLCILIYTHRTQAHGSCFLRQNRWIPKHAIIIVVVVVSYIYIYYIYLLFILLYTKCWACVRVYTIQKFVMYHSIIYFILIMKLLWLLLLW